MACIVVSNRGADAGHPGVRHHDRMLVLLDENVEIHGYYMSLLPENADIPDFQEACRGQQNGLCGAAVPGALSFATGLHTGTVPMTVQWFDDEPPVDEQWEDVVEVPFTPTGSDLFLDLFEDAVDLRLPAVVPLRARFCASGIDAAHELSISDDGELGPDRYLLQLWPADPRPDEVVRQTSEIAASWHRITREPPDALTFTK
jgi:hypothetical protein